MFRQPAHLLPHTTPMGDVLDRLDDETVDDVDQVFEELYALGLNPDSWETPAAEILVDACIWAIHCAPVSRVDAVLDKVGLVMSPNAPGQPLDGSNPEGSTMPLFDLT